MTLAALVESIAQSKKLFVHVFSGPTLMKEEMLMYHSLDTLGILIFHEQISL
jgi:hypothetical protein